MGNTRLAVAVACPLVLLIATSCTPSSTDPTSENDPLAVVEVANDDPAMQKAIAEARGSVDRFIAALQNPSPTQESFSIKMLVEDGEKGEHMWLFPVEFQDGVFKGQVNNDPADLPNVKFGDERSVSQDQITDWMYMEEGRIAGGYTLRVLIEQAPPEQAKQLREQMKFVDE